MLLPLLGHKPLTDWDEGIYAEVSREMLTFGPLVPHWNYQVWFEKPPLMLWITALLFKLFGVTEFWARAGSALSGVAIVSLLHAWLARAGDLLAAWLSTLLLLTTFGFLHVCRAGEMDVLLALGCSLALCGLAALQDREPRGWYLFWAGMAVALMTKGAACAPLVVTLIVFLILERARSLKPGRCFWLGFALFVVAVLPWHVFMTLSFGWNFWAEYLGLHVFARATHQLEDHVTHWWYYLWVLLLSAPPYVLLYPAAIVAGLRNGRLRIWAVFAVVTFIFFTMAQTRLPHYIAPSYPAFSLVTAVFLADRLRAQLRQSRQSPWRFWLTRVGGAIAIYVLFALLTTGFRGTLHQAKVAPDVVAAEKESIVVLRELRRHPPPVAGPLLVWWPGDQRSIATSVFYSRRPVQQVQGQAVPANIHRDKYLFDPKTLASAASPGERIILVDKSMLQEMPSDLQYTRLVNGSWMEAGIVERRGELSRFHAVH